MQPHVILQLINLILDSWGNIWVPRVFSPSVLLTYAGRLYMSVTSELSLNVCSQLRMRSLPAVITIHGSGQIASRDLKLEPKIFKILARLSFNIPPRFDYKVPVCGFGCRFRRAPLDRDRNSRHSRAKCLKAKTQQGH